MRYVLDTSALLAHYRQEVGWDEVQGLFESDESEIFVASVTLMGVCPINPFSWRKQVSETPRRGCYAL